jgi:hypothetical protein
MTALAEPFPAPPGLLPMTRIVCNVDALVNLGPTPRGERRYVALRGGSVTGPELNGRVVDGGVDWQLHRADGVLEIEAHYVLCLDDGALVEVASSGLRHGPAEVMARLARGEQVPGDAYFFRTLIRFTTSAPSWLHLNATMAIARGTREAQRVVLDVHRLT